MPVFMPHPALQAPKPEGKLQALAQALSPPGSELMPMPLSVVGKAPSALSALQKLVTSVGGKAGGAVPTAKAGARMGAPVSRLLNNASGESAASLEHLGRMQSMAKAGKSLVRKLPDGRTVPHLGSVDDVVNPGEALGWLGPGGAFERLR